MKGPITITAVGDISFGDSPKCLGFGVNSCVKNKGADYLFSRITSHLSGDIVFGNLETVLSNHGLRRYDFHSEQMRGEPNCVSALRKAGFNVLNVANNHIMQHGEEAFLETIALLADHNITVIGMQGTGLFKSTLKVLNIAEKTVGFLGYCFEKDRFVPQEQVKYACCISSNDICADIKRAKKEVDWLVVSAHWGLEFIDRPSITTIKCGRAFIDAGADIIIGHHPHVIQGTEFYNRGIICYSLGNFIFDMEWNKKCRKSIITRLKLSQNNTVSHITIPLEINKNYQPEHDPNKNDELHKSIKKLQQNIPKVNTAIDIEKYNLEYYQECRLNIFIDSIYSNIFFLIGFFKTPIKFLPGKLKNIISKVFRNSFFKISN